MGGRVTFEIEDGVPRTKAKASQKKYPFDDMDVDQSFFVPNEDNISLSSLQSRICTAICRFKDHHGSRKVFSTRQDKVKNGVRVWRDA